MFDKSLMCDKSFEVCLRVRYRHNCCSLLANCMYLKTLLEHTCVSFVLMEAFFVFVNMLECFLAEW
jgi:hypothetical protein